MTDNVHNYLGKIFHDKIRKEIDQNKIKRHLRQIEEIKLKIVDAAESGSHPPEIDGVEWLQKLQFCRKGYRPVWNEFNDWLVYNGLDCTFNTTYIDNEKHVSLKVGPNPY